MVNVISGSEVMGLNETPSANRLHIIILGACNSGKSSVLNLLTGQQTAMVSDVAGTTTDPVVKAMELPGAGACVFIDTAGFDDNSQLGHERVEATRKAIDKADIAMLLVGENADEEASWREMLNTRKIPVVEVANKADLDRTVPSGAVRVTTVGTGREKSRADLIDSILRVLPSDYAAQSLLRGLVQRGDSVLLVMPQDIQAPRGRLILPQVQTIRELLDNGCAVTCCTMENYGETLKKLKSAPELIITDSQVFRQVADGKPDASRLTSFSVLMAAYKGDIDYFVDSSRAIDKLTEGSSVLIAEACTHAPQNEDIGRVKIPAMLRKRFGNGLKIDVVSGTDFPDNLSGYDLIIHCGACMFNRKYVLNRVGQARNAGVPMTNYGITIAYLTGIIDEIVY